jgi:phosphoserine phosphatase
VVHNYFNVGDKAFLKEYLEGKIDYPEFMRRDISLWPKVKFEKIREIFKNSRLIPGAKETISKLKERSYITVLISAGLDILANKIGKSLRFDYIFANGLEVDKSSYLTGKGIYRVDLLQKDKILTKLSEKLKIPLNQFVAVGDSKFDISLLKKADLGIAFNPQDEEIKKVANVIIENRDLKEILKYI